MVSMPGSYRAATGCETGLAMFRRYAIYFTPAPGPLARFGADWLGWDLAAGGPGGVRPDVGPLPAPADDLTATPRRYGFHATIKPPFALAVGATADALAASLHAFCASHAPASLGRLRLVCVGSPERAFVALVPHDEVRALGALAANTVRDLDGFRASPSEADLARRRSAGLSARQEANLVRWGYPWVIEDFAVHMTLTGPLPAATAEAVLNALTPAIAELTGQPVDVDALSLVGEDNTGHFHLLERVPLTG